MIMEKIVPPRNRGRNAKRKSGGVVRAVWLLSTFGGIGNSYNNDNASLTLIFLASHAPSLVRWPVKFQPL